MIARVPDNAPRRFTGRSWEGTEDGLTLGAKVYIQSGREWAHFTGEWLADGGGDIDYPVELYSIKHWRLLLFNLNTGYPSIDWLRHLESARKQLAPNLESLTQLPSKRRLLTVEDLQALPAPSWIVEDHIPLGGLAIMYGPSGSGKTFVALDLSLSIEGGRPWMGNDVVSGPVLYIAAEGTGGLAQRVDAWRQSRADCDLSGIRFLTQGVNLLDEQDVTSLLADIDEMPMPPALVVIDTLARCLVGGDENSARDMGLAIAAADRIRQATGGTVVLVHHTGKNGDVERGSSALRGAADTMINVTNDDGLIKIQCDKQKDAPEFERIYARLVPMGESAVVGKDAGIALLDLNSPLSRQERAVLDVLSAIFGEDGATPTQLEEQARIPRRTIYVVLKNLIARGVIAKKGRGHAVRYIAVDSQECKVQ